MSDEYTIWIVTPPNYSHSRCFEEVALGLQSAFQTLGHRAPIVTSPERVGDSTAVVLGGNLLSRLRPQPWPLSMVIFNLEQVYRGAPWFDAVYLDVLRKCPVWDYSLRNIESLAREFGVHVVSCCGVGYSSALSRISLKEVDIDVLFIGSLSERRTFVLEALAQRGKRVIAIANKYGPERDDFIARAKLVVNVHLYDAQVFEIVRVSYLLANRKCVVSELGQDESLEAPFRRGVAFATYEDLAGECERLLDDSAERARLAEQGFAALAAMPQAPMLERALAALPPNSRRLRAS